MRACSVLLFLLVLASGCASQAQLPPGLAAEATPKEWTGAPTAAFRVINARGKPLGFFVLELTQERAEPCLGGDWFKAKPKVSDLAIFDLDSWWQDEALWPAYQIQGRILDVELNGGQLCDNYLTVLAQIDATGGHGHLDSSGLFRGKRYGSVVISLARPESTLK
jgi:hypothetical protein